MSTSTPSQACAKAELTTVAGAVTAPLLRSVARSRVSSVRVAVAPLAIVPPSAEAPAKSALTPTTFTRAASLYPAAVASETVEFVPSANHSVTVEAAVSMPELPLSV